MTTITEQTVRGALATVEDPEIGKPITELGMVKSIDIDGADVAVEVYLTIAGCPMKAPSRTTPARPSPTSRASVTSPSPST